MTAIDSDNHFLLFAPTRAAFDTAKKEIEERIAALREPTLEFGAIYTAQVVEVRQSGVTVRLFDGEKQLHCSHAVTYHSMQLCDLFSCQMRIWTRALCIMLVQSTLK